ncbi:MAG: hypothetical protein CVV56_08890 [Tenericutes bacterium HGW-Tenericutes-1]|jgi:cell fate (sporulation/competence/biofilm development) regulator YlbF (YheA/YmcA/DUF963 family)|nr:MAG: hypothetical protein CVV56_08890 [Tenericutes bacterium HGW-Tenericutes-1]
MDRTQLIDLTYEAVDEIKNLDIYKDYLNAKKAIDKIELSPLFEAFNQAKQQFDSVSKYGKYHPDYKQATLKLMEAKTALYSTKDYIAYQKANETLNLYLRNISFKITQMLSECLVTSDKKASCHTKGH